VKWKLDTGAPIGAASPVVAADGTIYLGSTGTKFIAVDPSGNMKWTLGFGAGVEDGATIGTDGTIYVGSNDAYVRAIDPSGHVKWTFPALASISPSPLVGADGTVFYGMEAVGV
jgi:outer membrane protein assembly factor BamB